MLVDAARGDLRQEHLTRSAACAVGVVLASRGYPASASSGQRIDGVEAADALDGVLVRHAGTALQDGQLVTAGGRVLTIVGCGDEFDEAMRRAYAGVACVHFDGMQFRRDIGRKALAGR